MPRILFRIIALSVCLLGFIGVGFACDKHSKGQPDASKSAKANVGTSAPEVVAEEFKNSSKAQVPQVTGSSEVAKIAVGNEKNNEPQNALLEVANTGIKVVEFVLANKVEGREPKEVVENFNQESGKGFAFAQLSAEKHAQIAFVWFKEGKEHSRFTTNVHASKKWRTYSSTKLLPGNWKVQLVAGDQVLAERTFTVQ